MKKLQQIFTVTALMMIALTFTPLTNMSAEAIANDKLTSHEAASNLNAVLGAFSIENFWEQRGGHPKPYQAGISMCLSEGESATFTNNITTTTVTAGNVCGNYLVVSDVSFLGPYTEDFIRALILSQGYGFTDVLFTNGMGVSIDDPSLTIFTNQQGQIFQGDSTLNEAVYVNASFADIAPISGALAEPVVISGVEYLVIEADSIDHYSNGISNPQEAILGILEPFTGVQCSDCTDLPIEVIDYDVEALSGSCQIQTNIKTQSETQFSHFEIERGINGVHYMVIDTLRGGVGNESIGADYYHLDDPGPGTFYYRYRAVNTDGTYEYSEVNVVTSDCHPLEEVTISPNPASNGFFRIKVPDFFLHNGNARLNFFDSMGRNLGNLPISELETLVSTRELASGAYFINATGSGRTQTLPIVVRN